MSFQQFFQNSLYRKVLGFSWVKFLFDTQIVINNCSKPTNNQGINHQEINDQLILVLLPHIKPLVC